MGVRFVARILAIVHYKTVLVFRSFGFELLRMFVRGVFLSTPVDGGVI